MTTKNKHLFLALAATAIITAIVVAYYLHRKKMQSTSAQPGAAPALAASTSTAAADESASAGMGGSSGGWSPALTVSAPAVVKVAAPAVINTPVLSKSELLESINTPPPIRQAPVVTEEEPVHNPILPIYPSGGNLSGVGIYAESAGGEPSTRFPLKPGAVGPEVEALQSFLVSEHGAQFPAGITGNFDGHTQAAVARHLRRDAISEAFFNKVGMGNRRRL